MSTIGRFPRPAAPQAEGLQEARHPGRLDSPGQKLDPAMPGGLQRKGAMRLKGGGLPPRNGQLPGGNVGQAQAWNAQARPDMHPALIPGPRRDNPLPPDMPAALIPGGRPQLPPRPQAWRPTPQEAAQFQGAVPAALVPGRPAQPLGAPLWPTPQEAAQLQGALPPRFPPANNRPQVPAKPPELMPQAQPQWPAQGAAAAVAMPDPAQHLQHARWQPGIPQHMPVPAQDAYPIHVRPQRHGQPKLHPGPRHATNVPLATVPQHFHRLFQQLNLRITPDTKPAYTNENVLTTPQKLGSGAFNTVYEMQLRKPDGSSFVGVFKPLGTEEGGWVAAATGIPRHNPQIAMRNIATQAYGEKLLGIKAVPDTRVAVIEAGPHAQLEGPKLGLVMEKAQGQPAAKTGLDLLDRAKVRAEVTNLQLLDHLTGQGDRHANNYFIDYQGGHAKVTGIDNDQCFGHRLTDPNGIRYANNRTQYGFRGTTLPPVVDYEMAMRINSLTPDQIRQELGDKLAPAEVEAAVLRHEGVKQHIINLERQGHVIHPDDWSQNWVTQLLNGGNSYIGRERERAIADEARARAQVQGQGQRQPNPGW